MSVFWRLSCRAIWSPVRSASDSKKFVDISPPHIYVPILFHLGYEGRLASVTNVGMECGGRGRLRQDARGGPRTQKSCGPGTPGLVLSLRDVSQATVTNKVM